jgi:lipopolysaccharide biosynthesis glycosyltransferase
MNKEIPIFFSIDDGYIPCLGVAIKSIQENAKDEFNYHIYVLYTQMSEENINNIKTEFAKDNFIIEFYNIEENVKEKAETLSVRLRDYYSNTIYYRLFIQNEFPQYDKALYIDSDIVLVDDIAKLYNRELGDHLLGVVRDGVVEYGPEILREYVKNFVCVPVEQYFNSGVLVMNLKEMRKAKIEERFLYLIDKYNIDTVAPDQDYLNVLCQGRTLMIPESWDKMPDFCGGYPDINDLHLIHYNMFRKPWHYADVAYQEAFWKYAKQTSYYDTLQNELKNYPQAKKEADFKGAEGMNTYCSAIMTNKINFKTIYDDAVAKFGEV